MLRSQTLHRRTASDLNWASNDRRFRFAMDHSLRIFARFGVSTKPGEDQSEEDDRQLQRRVGRRCRDFKFH
jgi:hypothetical protein